jgi:dTDP-glucose 4,6-dehydratase
MKGFKIYIVLLLIVEFVSLAATDHVRKKVFLTGACGFIGSNFLTYMFNKYPEYDFVVLDALTYAGSLDNVPAYIQESERFKFFEDTVVNFELVDEIMSDSDYVVHFAAETHVTRSIVDDYVFFETDLLGTRSLMRALVKYADKVERFIHISTSEVYGTADYEPMDECHPINPRSPYAAAKAAADRLVYAYNCTFDIPVVIVRPFNNYGPRQHPEKMIPRFISAAMNGRPLQIHGDGLQSRDWLYVEDTAVALDKLMHSKEFSKIKGQAINIGSGKATSVIEIARKILEKFDLPECYLEYVEDRPGQVECHIADIKKVESFLDWKPEVLLEKGLELTIDWYINNYVFCKKFENDAEIPIQLKGGKIALQ